MAAQPTVAVVVIIIIITITYYCYSFLNKTQFDVFFIGFHENISYLYFTSILHMIIHFLVKILIFDQRDQNV